MTRMTLNGSLAVAIVVLVAALVERPSGRTTARAVPERANAFPSMAASDRFVAIAWGATTKDGTTETYVAVSRDAGRTFGAPNQVSDAGSTANLSGEQPPRVSLVSRTGRDPGIVIVWTSRAAAGTRLLSARSDDGGRSFTRPTGVPGSDGPGNRGWEATATDSRGDVVAVWLDHRALAKPAEGATGTKQTAHQHGRHAEGAIDGTARAQLSKLYFARLGDAGSGRELTGGVCYCCKTTIATGGDGAIYVAWRHVYAGNVRDIAFTMSKDAGRTFATPTRVSVDNWVLDGCPENGPSMVVDAGGNTHLIWPTLVPGPTPLSEPTLALFYSMSRAGQAFTPRQRIPTEGVPRHPQIAVGPRGAVIVAWEEQAEGTRRVAVGRGTRDSTGTIRFVRQGILDSAQAVYPAVVSTVEGIVAAWTSGAAGQTVLRTTRVPD